MDNSLVYGNVRLATIHGTECKATLLQLAFGIIPVLVHNKLVKTWKKAYLAECATMLQALRK